MMQDSDRRDLQADILAILGRAPRRARFVTEVASQLARSSIGIDLLEQSLEELENSGQVLVREQYCGDPHLAGTDLRIVARVQPRGDDACGQEDPLARAIDAIESIWSRWLADYLSNHRCG